MNWRRAGPRVGRPAGVAAGVRHPRAGFSLIEVIIALVIFSIGILGLGITVPMATRRISNAGQQTRASELAAERAEQLLTTPYADDELSEGVHTDAANPQMGTYYVSWTVTENQPITSCKRVRVTVSRGGVHSPPLVSLTIVVPES